MRLYDTSRSKIAAFEPGPVVRMYTCGITPYDATHLGHGATYVTYDVLYRRLLDRGHEVRLVRNITDIDDDLFARARRDDINYLDLAFGQKRQFDEDMASLGNIEPWSEPRATSAIPDIRGLIAEMLGSGAAYESDSWVYFDHRAAATFGSVSGHNRVDMRSIGQGRGEDPTDERKRHPIDTVLWRPSELDEPAWESPWGRGRPGWHIECVALGLRELGSIDLHGGGCDLVYPHHEFTAAQLDVLSAGSPVGHWMHQACVHLDGEPMAKSTGNLIFIRDLLDTVEPMTLRLAVLSQHYRTDGWAWSDELVDRASIRLELWRSTGEGEGPLAEVRAALDDDLDVPAAALAIDNAARSGEGVSASAALIGVTL